jgi:hypothetical protein
MGLDDFVDAEVGVAVAATAAILSPRAREVMRRGAVYGLAGVLTAGDLVASAVRGVASGARGVAADAGGDGRASAAEAQPPPPSPQQPPTPPTTAPPPGAAPSG